MNQIGSGNIAPDLAAWQDYGDSEMLEEALAELLKTHEELARVVRAHNTLVELIQSTNRTPDQRKKDTVAARLKRVESARFRRQSGKIGLLQYLRIRIWIATKSRGLDTHDDSWAAVVNASVKIDSDFLGDKPIRTRLRKREYLAATVWSRSLMAKHFGNANFIQLCRDLAVKRGNISEVLSLTHQIFKIRPNDGGRGVRQVEGRLKEISGWIPNIPGPRERIEPSNPNTIVHLVKESRPFLSNGFTSRSHRNFQSELAAGLNPIVVTELGFPRNEVGADFDLTEVLDGIEHHRLDLGPDYRAESVAQWLQDFAWLAFKKIKEIRPAVIHVSSGRRGFETALVGLALQEKTGLPLVYEVRSFFEGTWTGEVAVETQGETFARRMAIEKMCMERADFVLTIGESMRDEIVSRGIPADKVAIVPNGVDLESFVPLSDATALRDHFGIRGVTFGYVSNMDHFRESQETLIEATKVLQDRGYSYQCVLVGSGSRLDYLKNYAVKLGVSDQVIFTGSVDHKEIPGHYAMIDIFVVPRIEERASRYVTPLKPFEAMAMKKPIIVSDLPALTEIVDPPLRGLTFPVGDADRLADKIHELAMDKDIRTRLGLAGRRWIERERQWSMNGRVYRDVFNRLQIESAGIKNEA